MENKIVKLGPDAFKDALKSQINDINVDDHVVLNISFEKLPGSLEASKHIDISIDKCCGDVLDDDED